MPRVTFQPDGVGVDVETGTSLLDAARSAGVRLRNDCGGRGTCGRCRIRVESGQVHRLHSRFELEEGEDLACRCLTLESDVAVRVPDSSREATEDVTVREIEALPEKFPPDGALVKRVNLSLSPPSLEDNLPDDERVVAALEEWRPGNYSFPPEVLKDLPGRLRRAEWDPEVTLAIGTCGSQILDVNQRTDTRPAILAVDVGTTSLKAELLAPGCHWKASCYNSQLIYGPDVITRIIHCQQNEDGLRDMQSTVAGDVNRLLTALLEAAGMERERVWGVVATGNTTMIHLLMGMEPLWIRREPYVGCSYRVPQILASELGLDINPRGMAYCLPSVSSFVGSDVTAGVMATGLHESPKPKMLIDLGTNGEIVIGSRDFLACCSASAGPAFEGEASASGTRAMPGAIESVWWDDGLCWETIEDRLAVGICGTGYIDLLAELVEHGVVDRTGRFRENASSCLRKRDDGTQECVLIGEETAMKDEDIVLTQCDIDNLVRAKGAIYAAASVLLDSLGMEWNDLESIMLAGAFGEKMDKGNAVRIGLLPDVPREKIEFAGNTSLEGGIMAAVDEGCFATCQSVARRMTYFELSTHPDYMDQFVAARFLPHTDPARFPTVCQTEPAG